MKVALLGGGGCFALNFARLLNEQDIPHFGIGRSARKPFAFWQVDHHYKYHQLHLVDQLPAILGVLDTERPDVIVNFAAQGEGAASFGVNAPDYFQTNVVALSKLVLELQSRTYWHRFIQIGSSEVYGSPATPAQESDLLDPTSPYSISKAAFDQYLQSMYRTAKFPMNIIRPSNCYTEGQQLYRVIPKTMVMALNGQKLQLHGGGRAQKSYLHATDLSKAILRVMEVAPFGTIYNVGPDEAMSIRDLVEGIAITMGKTLEDVAEVAPDRVGQDAKYHLNVKAMKALGWHQEIDLTCGLTGMFKWIVAHPEVLAMSTSYEHRK